MTIRKALLKSIMFKWIPICLLFGKSRGGVNCYLCQKFVKEGGCVNCIVKKKTGRSGCGGTTYWKFMELTDEGKARSFKAWVYAVKYLIFLISLWPLTKKSKS